MCILDELSEERFENVVSRMKGKYIQEGKNDCWPWTAGKKSDGYGIIFLYRKPRNAKTPKKRGSIVTDTAARVMYSDHHNIMLGDWHVLHTCDNPQCVNPHHLFLGTNYDNVKDKIKKGRGVNVKGVRHPNSILSEHNIKTIRSLGDSTPQSEIAESFGISQVHAGRIINRKAWKHVK